MNRIIITLLLALGAACFSASPAIAFNAESGIQQQSKNKKTQTVSFKVGMRCNNCVKKINDNISFEKGVKDLKISLDEKKVTITYDPSKTNPATLAKAIEKLGYKVEPLQAQ